MLGVLDGDFMTYTRHEPLGVCGQIIPVGVHGLNGFMQEQNFASQTFSTISSRTHAPLSRARGVEAHAIS